MHSKRGQTNLWDSDCRALNAKLKADAQNQKQTRKTEEENKEDTETEAWNQEEAEPALNRSRTEAKLEQKRNANRTQRLRRMW